MGCVTLHPQVLIHTELLLGRQINILGVLVGLMV